MTKTIPKKPIIATITAVLVATVLIASNSVIAQSETITSPCPSDGQVEHWDKVVFEISKDKSGTISKEDLKSTMEIKIRDAPEQVINLEDRVATFVGAEFRVDPDDLKIKIKEVLYQTVSCASTSAEPSALTFYTNSEFVSSPETFGIVMCDEGDIATGGGFFSDAGVPPNFGDAALGSFPADQNGDPISPVPFDGSPIVDIDGTIPAGWVAEFATDDPENVVYVICADITP